VMSYVINRFRTQAKKLKMNKWRQQNFLAKIEEDGGNSSLEGSPISSDEEWKSEDFAFISSSPITSADPYNFFKRSSKKKKRYHKASKRNSKKKTKRTRKRRLIESSSNSIEASPPKRKRRLVKRNVSEPDETFFTPQKEINNPSKIKAHIAHQVNCYEHRVSDSEDEFLIALKNMVKEQIKTSPKKVRQKQICESKEITIIKYDVLSDTDFEAAVVEMLLVSNM